MGTLLTASLLGRIRLDIDNIADMEGTEVGGHADRPVLPEPTLEHVASARTVTKGMRHGVAWVG